MTSSNNPFYFIKLLRRNAVLYIEGDGRDLGLDRYLFGFYQYSTTYMFGF